MIMLHEALIQIVGEKGWTTDPVELEPHLTERRGAVRGKASIMVSPSTTDQVAAVVRACADNGTSIVPQGGNTGLCGGAIPDQTKQQVLLSLSRMNKIRKLDANDYSVIVEAGCILADIQHAAMEAGRYFPLSLAAEGSCQIGGNLSTNAGGINVLRYGTARQQVLGLEAVLADGTVWDGLRTVRKDTAGYDLKQLFIGSEGTLGIITTAALKLWPDPGNTLTVLAAIREPQHAVELLSKLRDALGDSIQAFELISDRCFDFVEKHIPDARLPLARDYPWFILTELAVQADTGVVEEQLMGLIEDELVADAVIAKNEAEAAGLWRLRHSISESQKPEGASLKHDVSVPISRVAEFVAKGQGLVETLLPGARLVAFGHVGDGNLHFNVSQAPGDDGDHFRQRGLALTEAIYDLAISMGGSFSAEHGVGVTKKSYLEQYRGGTEVELMRTLKAALDPQNTLNPGKVI
jgi:FAD/FMN-containing dehydrogenase